MRFAALFACILVTALGCSGNQQPSSEWHRYCQIDATHRGRAHAITDEVLVSAALRTLTALKLDDSVVVPRELRKWYHLEGAREVQYLDGLCQSYRDDPAMLAGKLKLLANYRHVPEYEAAPYQAEAPIWQQLDGDRFRNLVRLSRSLSQYDHSLERGSLNGCEYRFVLKEYLVPRRSVMTAEDVVQLRKEKAQFLEAAVAAGECTAEEVSTYYSFRGSGYISPRDPEAAVMRQVGMAAAEICSNSTSIENFSCGRFLENPSGVRREVALQLLRRLLMAGPEEIEVLKQRWLPIFFTEDLNRDGVGEAVIPVMSDSKKLSLAKSHAGALYQSFISPAHRSGMSKGREHADIQKVVLDELHNAASGNNAESYKLVQASPWDSQYESERDQGLAGRFRGLDGARAIEQQLDLILNRHTFYYQTYLYLSALRRLLPSTTPFLSTSGDIAQAYKFALRGFTAGRVQKPKLGWLFVFKLSASHIYGSKELASQRQIDFAHDWLDEAGLATHPFAREERGLDRFAEPNAAELSELLYLGDIGLPSEMLVLFKTESSEETPSSDLLSD